MLLEDLKFEGMAFWEDLDTWGIDPILTLLELFDQFITEKMDDDPTLTFFYYELRHKVERLQKAFHKLGDGVDEALKKTASQAEPEVREPATPA